MKVIKQDVMNSLKVNLNESNIAELIDEIKDKSELNFTITVNQKGYKW
jgi:hypothetical protein